MRPVALLITGSKSATKTINHTICGVPGRLKPVAVEPSIDDFARTVEVVTSQTLLTVMRPKRPLGFHVKTVITIISATVNFSPFPMM